MSFTSTESLFPAKLFNESIIFGIFFAFSFAGPIFSLDFFLGIDAILSEPLLFWDFYVELNFE